MKKAALYSIKNIEFDYLILDHPLLDRYGHYLYLGSGRKRNLAVMKDGYLATDKNLSEILNAIDNKNTSLMVVSGHGFSHSHTGFSTAKLFESLGVKVSPAKDAKISVFSSKVSAHIFLNDRNVNLAEKTRFLKDLKRKLQKYRDPNSGKIIFKKVLLHSELKRYKLNNSERSGDLWVSLKPGYTFGGIIASDKFTGKSIFSGEHGYFDNSLEAKGFISYFGSKKINNRSNIKYIADIAPIIYQLLNIK